MDKTLTFKVCKACLCVIDGELCSFGCPHDLEDERDGSSEYERDDSSIEIHVYEFARIEPYVAPEREPEKG